jgi:predicted nucleic acid-binding protein
MKSKLRESLTLELSDADLLTIVEALCYMNGLALKDRRKDAEQIVKLVTSQGMKISRKDVEDILRKIQDPKAGKSRK